jgi:hypothetical protein
MAPRDRVRGNPAWCTAAPLRRALWYRSSARWLLALSSVHHCCDGRSIYVALRLSTNNRNRRNIFQGPEIVDIPSRCVPIIPGSSAVLGRHNRLGSAREALGARGRSLHSLCLHLSRKLPAAEVVGGRLIRNFLEEAAPLPVLSSISGVGANR